MEERSKSEKKRSSKFLSSLTWSKKTPQRKGHSEILPGPALRVTNADPTIADNQGANTTARSPPTESRTEPPTEPAQAAAVDKNSAVNTDADGEKLPTSVAISQDRLNKAGEKLKAKLPADLLAS